MSKVRPTKVSTDNSAHTYLGKSVVLPINVLAATLVMAPLFMSVAETGVSKAGNRALEGKPNSQLQIDFSAPILKAATTPTIYKTSVQHTAGHVVSVNTHAIDLTALPDAAFGDRD